MSLSLLSRYGPLPGPLLHLLAHFRIPSYRKVHTLAQANLQALDAAKGDRERTIILGSAWAGLFFFDDLG